jgi:hypothetical protein
MDSKNPSSRRQIRHPGKKSVIPAQAGIHGGGQPHASMDPGLRRDDMRRWVMSSEVSVAIQAVRRHPTFALTRPVNPPCRQKKRHPGDKSVIPAKKNPSSRRRPGSMVEGRRLHRWIPACAGMTCEGGSCHPRSVSPPKLFVAIRRSLSPDLLTRHAGKKSVIPATNPSSRQKIRHPGEGRDPWWRAAACVDGSRPAPG